MNTLDQLLPSSGVDVIKIDVEGAELQVIIGGKNVINSDFPVVYFESGSDVELELLNGIWKTMNEMEYRIVVPNRLAHHDEEGLSLVGFLESHKYSRRSTNYFAVPAKRRVEIRERARKILSIL